MKLSEVFKFGITPTKDRFTATILDEASKTTDDDEHLNMIDSMVGGIVAGEIDEDMKKKKRGVQSEINLKRWKNVSVKMKH